MGITSRTFDVPTSSQANGVASSTEKISRVKLTDKEKKRLEVLIKDAKSLQDIAMIEKALNEGRLPPGLADEV